MNVPHTDIEFTTSDPEATQALAATLARVLRHGDVILLNGELGAGKTQFVRGLARGLGHEPALVSSPTFVLMNEYAAEGVPLRLVHIDAYRLGGSDDLDAIGFDAATRPDARSGCVVAIEWPSKLGERVTQFDPERVVEVTLTHEAEGVRKVRVRWPQSWRVWRSAERWWEIGKPRSRTWATCPVTGQAVAPDCPTWPFASEQAKLADLGHWLTGGYVISRDLTEDDLDAGRFDRPSPA